MIGKLLRKFNDFKGKQRLSRLFLGPLIKNGKDIKIEGKYGCKYKVPNLKEVIGFELYINGIFEEEYINLILSKLPQNGFFIDLGANIGSITIPICKLRPDIKSMAVEASTLMTSYLNFNIQNNNINNCIIEHNAIWNKSGEIISFFSPNIQYGKGMVSLSNDEDNLEKVTTTTIDDLCKKNGFNKVDFIKVDIEGFEYFAFRGGMNLLKEEHAPDILFEFIASSEIKAKDLDAGDAQAILMSYGYNLYSVHNGKLDLLKKPLTEKFSMIYATKNKL